MRVGFPGRKAKLARDGSCVRHKRAASGPYNRGDGVIFTYAGAIFIKRLNDAGRTAITLDCFAGDRETVTIRFEDQTTVARQPIVEEEMRDLSKVTIVWSGAVDLDLHAFEYSATFGGPGHVWSEQPRSLGEVTAER